MRNLQSSSALGNDFNPWNILRMFFKSERVDAWYEAITAQGTEVIQNLFCLSQSAHKYHERA